MTIPFYILVFYCFLWPGDYRWKLAFWLILVLLNMCNHVFYVIAMSPFKWTKRKLKSLSRFLFLFLSLYINMCVYTWFCLYWLNSESWLAAGVLPELSVFSLHRCHLIEQIIHYINLLTLPFSVVKFFYKRPLKNPTCLARLTTRWQCYKRGWIISLMLVLKTIMQAKTCICLWVSW